MKRLSNLLLILSVIIPVLVLSSCMAAEFGMNTGSFYYNGINYDTTFGNTEEYSNYIENPFLTVISNPLSTFSIDVDTASYANMRRYINGGELPPADSVRIEEFINYFTYDYPQPQNGAPFSITTEAALCPWNGDHYLAMIALQAESIEIEELPPNNLVFLIDVSGSMSDDNKLPLLKQSFALLVNKLRSIDKVSIVVYAGAAGAVLQSTSGNKKQAIMNAINNLQAGGSTAGGAGINLAYSLALDNFIPNGNNRVILATDGDFNVGISGPDALKELIVSKRESGIYLTVLGFGMWNLQDASMETLADYGNGNYFYIDNFTEATKVFNYELVSTLYTVANDVKIQVEFNPDQVYAYRLIGYENRVLNNEDFTNDAVDAGDIGAGHSVTAFYEIVLTNSENINATSELITLSLRYKLPNTQNSLVISNIIDKSEISIGQSTENFRFAASVAEYGLILKNSQYKGTANYANIVNTASISLGADNWGYRNEFIQLVNSASQIE